MQETSTDMIGVGCIERGFNLRTSNGAHGRRSYQVLGLS
jgi:hypothetical protein